MSDIFNYLYKKHTATDKFNILCNKKYGMALTQILYISTYNINTHKYYDDKMIIQTCFYVNESITNIDVFNINKGYIKIKMDSNVVILSYPNIPGKICEMFVDDYYYNNITNNINCPIMFSYENDSNLAKMIVDLNKKTTKLLYYSIY